MICDGDSKGIDGVDSEWSDPPVDYNLSTIGIEEAFVVSPPKEQDNKDDDEKISKEAQSGGHKHATYMTWEIVGKIKSIPEDFVVREIGGVPRQLNNHGRSDAKKDQRVEGECEAKVADLTDAYTLPPKESYHSDVDSGNNENEMDVGDEQVKGELSVDRDGENNVEKPKSVPIPVQYERTHEGVLRAILRNCIRNDKAKTGDVYNEIQKLYDDAIQDLYTNVHERGEVHHGDGASSIIKNNPMNSITISPISDNIIIQREGEAVASTRGCNRNRGTFHRTLKVLFPLLKSSTLDMKIENQGSSEPESSKKREESIDKHSIIETINEVGEGSKNIDRKIDDEKGFRYIHVEKDTTFHKLVPYLINPQTDLIKLYKFRNSPIPPFSPTSYRNSSSTRQGRRHKRRQSEKQKRGKCSERDEAKSEETRTNEQREYDTSNIQNDGSEAEMEVLLHLKTDVAREKRKDVHHIIAESCRDFQTSTRNDVLVPGITIFNKNNATTEGDMTTNTNLHDHAAIKTTAIVVQWSRQAQNTAMKRKRKRSEAVNDHQAKKKQQMESKPHTLCVMRKCRQEHLAAVNHLVAALKCRQSDIGLAGIKDMQAVTYQYCTLRNLSPFRARKGNEYLRTRGMELGNFDRVSWLLNQGDLSGNSFDIVIRDLGRVQTRTFPGGIKKERFVPCDEDHINAMVNRIRKSGFVNFYGEQRVGEAGLVAGVRAGDIGRAMLQQNFSKAIDLLMEGRDKGRGGEYAESDEIRNMRKIYKDSGGDPKKTLAAFPRGSALGRERAVLQGLRRYGREKPLEAMRCLSYSVRTFWINAYQVSSKFVEIYNIYVLNLNIYSF